MAETPQVGIAICVSRKQLPPDAVPDCLCRGTHSQLFERVLTTAGGFGTDRTLGFVAESATRDTSASRYTNSSASRTSRKKVEAATYYLLIYFAHVVYIIGYMYRFCFLIFFCISPSFESCAAQLAYAY